MYQQQAIELDDGGGIALYIVLLFVQPTTYII